MDMDCNESDLTRQHPRGSISQWLVFSAREVFYGMRLEERTKRLRITSEPRRRRPWGAPLAWGPLGQQARAGARAQAGPPLASTTADEHGEERPAGEEAATYPLPLRDTRRDVEAAVKVSEAVSEQ